MTALIPLDNGGLFAYTIEVTNFIDTMNSAVWRNTQEAEEAPLLRV